MTGANDIIDSIQTSMDQIKNGVGSFNNDGLQFDNLVNIEK